MLSTNDIGSDGVAASSATGWSPQENAMIRRLKRENHLLRMQVLRLREGSSSQHRSADSADGNLENSPPAQQYGPGSAARKDAACSPLSPSLTATTPTRSLNSLGEEQHPGEEAIVVGGAAAMAEAVRLRALQRKYERERVQRNALEREVGVLRETLNRVLAGGALCSGGATVATGAGVVSAVGQVRQLVETGRLVSLCSSLAGDGILDDGVSLRSAYDSARDTSVMASSSPTSIDGGTAEPDAEAEEDRDGGCTRSSKLGAPPRRPNSSGAKEMLITSSRQRTTAVTAVVDSRGVGASFSANDLTQRLHGDQVLSDGGGRLSPPPFYRMHTTGAFSVGNISANSFAQRSASRREMRRQRLNQTVGGGAEANGGGGGDTTGTLDLGTSVKSEPPRRSEAARSDGLQPLVSLGRRAHIRDGGESTGAMILRATFDTTTASSSGVAPGGGSSSAQRRAGRAPTDLFVGTAELNNPNQIGIEIDGNVRNRSWYLQQALAHALLRVIQSYDKTIAKEEQVGSEPRPPDTGENVEEDIYSSSSVMSSLDNSPIRPSGKAAATTGATRSRAATRPESPAVAVEEERLLIYKDVPLATLQRAIGEVVHVHCHCSGNEVKLTSGKNPPYRPLRPFAEDNSDPNLRSTFSPSHMDGGAAAAAVAPPPTAAASTEESDGGTYRDDELTLSMHAPVIFRHLGKFLNLNLSQFHLALRNASWRESASPGKSGTMLYYFGDFVMKTVKQTEFELFTERYLPAYVPYAERNPHSLLPQFYGLVTMRWLKQGVTMRFILMRNVFATRHYIRRIYDVKGSTVGRTALEPGKEPPRTAFGALLLKDNDLPSQLIICGEYQRAILLAQFRSDVAFLHGLNIVDYSCMIGVRSRIFSREEGPSSTIFLRKKRSSTSAAEDRRSTLQSLLDDQHSKPGDECIAVGRGSGTFIAATNIAPGVDVSVCIHGCDGGLLSLPMYSPGDDTTAKEDVYYLGIIDVLQGYTAAKRIESIAKGFVNDRMQISVIPPREYAERLYRTLERIST